MINITMKIAFLTFVLFPSISIAATAPGVSYGGVGAAYQTITYKDNLSLGLPLNNGLSDNYVLAGTKSTQLPIYGLTGYRWNDFAVEFSFQMSPYSDHLINTDATTNITGIDVSRDNYAFNFDIVHRYTINKKLKLKSSLGFGYIYNTIYGSVYYYRDRFDDKHKSYSWFSHSSHGVGGRLGVGLQYYFSDSRSAGITYNYQQGNKLIKSIQGCGLELVQYF